MLPVSVVCLLAHEIVRVLRSRKNVVERLSVFLVFYQARKQRLCFKTRSRDLSLRSPEKLTAARAHAFNRNIVTLISSKRARERLANTTKKSCFKDKGVQCSQNSAGERGVVTTFVPCATTAPDSRSDC